MYERKEGMFTSKNLVLALGFCLAVIVALPAAQGEFVSPTAVPYHSEDYVSGVKYGVGKLIDGIYGPTADTYNTVVMIDDTPLDIPNTGYLVFDMGSSKKMDGAQLWARHVSDTAPFPTNVDFFSLVDDNPANNTFGNSRDLFTDADIVSLGNFVVPDRQDGTSVDVAFGSSITKRYIGMRINDTSYPSTEAPGSNIQFQEAMFNVQTPEPSAVVLLATGLFGLLAYAWRKRK
jgi:hypothetical protein